MNDLRIIDTLCYIVEQQAAIIRAQSLRLGELGAVAMVDEIAEVDKTLQEILGQEEILP